MEVLRGVLLALIAIATLELMLHVAGVLLRKASSHNYSSSTSLPPARKLLVVSLAVAALGAMELVRLFAATAILERTGGNVAEGGFVAWLVTSRVASVPLLPASALLATAFAALREGAIGACDRCNEWIAPGGGYIWGDSWGSEDLNCLRCALTKRPQALLLYPLSKLQALGFWLTKGLWQ